MAVLEVKDLWVLYGNIEAVKGVSIEVSAGEVVSILGSNGAGKSTTLRAISGLQRPRSGRTTFAGEDITSMPAHRIVARGLSHVPEGRRIFTTLTVDENLTLGGYLVRGNRVEQSRRRERVFDIFPRLKERLHQVAGTLSGGEQQMLTIGRALMSQPRLLALDEPSLGLSPMLAREVLKVVRQIANGGVAVLLVEQNARQALRVSDRAYVLETGSIVLEGTAGDLAADERVRRAYLGGFEGISATTAESAP